MCFVEKMGYYPNGGQSCAATLSARVAGTWRVDKPQAQKKFRRPYATLGAGVLAARELPPLRCHVTRHILGLGLPGFLEICAAMRVTSGMACAKNFLNPRQR